MLPQRSPPPRGRVWPPAMFWFLRSFLSRWHRSRFFFPFLGLVGCFSPPFFSRDRRFPPSGLGFLIASAGALPLFPLYIVLHVRRTAARSSSLSVRRLTPGEVFPPPCPVRFPLFNFPQKVAKQPASRLAYLSSNFPCGLLLVLLRTRFPFYVPQRDRSSPPGFPYIRHVLHLEEVALTPQVLAVHPFYPFERTLP